MIGGCGSQVGLLASLSLLGLIGLFCSLCLLANLVSITVTEEIATSAGVEPVEPGVPDDEMALIRARVERLAGRVESLRAETLIPPTPTPPPPKPVALAHMSGVNLRSGPGETYSRLGRLPKGDSLEIVGRNADGRWWLVVTPDGSFAWVADMAVMTANLDDSIVVVTIPALLSQPSANNAAADGSPGLTTAPAAEPASLSPADPPAPVSRRFVLDTPGYRHLIRGLLLPTVSESFSPDGRALAITERINLYTIPTEGGRRRVLVGAAADGLTLVSGTVWSPDGQYLAFVFDHLGDCDPCRRVGLVRLSDGAIIFLEPPPDSALHKPRWTEDGRLLVTAYLDDPAAGRAFVYDTTGQGRPAEGRYTLSSSHDGQKWFPWQPGRPWQVEGAAPDSYYQ